MKSSILSTVLGFVKAREFMKEPYEFWVYLDCLIFLMQIKEPGQSSHVLKRLKAVMLNVYFLDLA